ncbi:Nn.00g103440.m01.CDS01 [Neocucurbitaria sp. VM-36]
MLFLIPLLLTSSLVAAAPRHRRGVTKTHTTTTVTTVTVLNTLVETADVPLTQPTQSVVQDQEPASVTTDTGYTLSQSQSSAATPSSTEDDQTVALKVDTSSTEASSDTTLERMSTSEVEAIYKTCWGGILELPLPGTPNPVVDVVAPQLSIFTLPIAKADTLTVHNYCSYDIFFDHFKGESKLESGSISAGASFDSPLSGTVMKVSKSSNMGKDMLIEYSVADGNLYYDLSLITCLGQTDGLENNDTSGCAGHEAGLQLGNSVSKSFQCAAGAWCDDQVYLYQENLCKKQNPVSSCSPSHGLTMEFCASQKS